MLRYLSHSKALLPKPFFTTAVPRPGPPLYHRAIMALPSPPPAEPLPPLSRQDKDTYGRMGQTMEFFHNSFRETYKILYSACSSGKRPTNMSIRQFLNTGAEFCHHLHMHHSIEEQHIFPVLAVRMPAFRRELELLTQHKEIHKGIDKLEIYVDDCKGGKRDLRMEELYVDFLNPTPRHTTPSLSCRESLESLLAPRDASRLTPRPGGATLIHDSQKRNPRQLRRRTMGASERRSRTTKCGENAEIRKALFEIFIP